MINGIVQHFGETILQNIDDIFWQFTQAGCYISTPNPVFLQFAIKGVAMQPQRFGFKTVTGVPQRTIDFDKVFVDQLMDMPIDRLAGNAKCLSPRHWRGLRMFFNIVENELADFLAMFTYTNHESNPSLLILWFAIVNVITMNVNKM